MPTPSTLEVAGRVCGTRGGVSRDIVEDRECGIIVWISGVGWRREGELTERSAASQVRSLPSGSW